MGKRIPSSVPLLLIRGCELSYAPGWIHAVDFFFFLRVQGFFLSGRSLQLYKIVITFLGGGKH